jgi:hypothetical protein
MTICVWRLTEAGQGRLGTLREQLLLLCYHYDPQSGTYNSRIMLWLQIAGMVTVRWGWVCSFSWHCAAIDGGRYERALPAPVAAIRLRTMPCRSIGW